MNSFTAKFASDSTLLAEMPFSLSPGHSISVGNLKGQADLRISADSVSRKHLYIAMDGDGGLLVCDAGSSNGSFVSGIPLNQSQWHRLRPGEKIGLGREISLDIWEAQSGKAHPPIPLADPDKTLLESEETTEHPEPKKRNYPRSKESEEDEALLSRKDLELLAQIAAQESQSSQSKSIDNLSETIAFLLIVALAICGALTNPSKKDHLKAISDRNKLEGALVEFASDLGAVKYRNFVVFSLLDIDGEVATIGVFKNVIFNEGIGKKANKNP